MVATPSIFLNMELFIEMQPLLEAAVIDSQDYYKPLHVDNVQLTIADAEYVVSNAFDVAGDSQ